MTAERLANLEQQAQRLDALIPNLTDAEARQTAEIYRRELSVRIMRLRHASMMLSFMLPGGEP